MATLQTCELAMADLRYLPLPIAFLLGGCTAVSGLLTKINFIDKATSVISVPADTNGTYVHLTGKNAATDLVMVLPQISSEEIVLRRSGTEWVTLPVETPQLQKSAEHKPVEIEFFSTVETKEHALETVTKITPKQIKLAEIIPPNTSAIKRYAMLEYGAKKPLVCQNTVSPEGKLKRRPNLQVMWENYLYNRPEGIWGEIGGHVEINGNLPHDQGRWTNACAVRLSHMLIKAGHRIPQRFGLTSSGANNDQYFFRYADMKDYIHEIMGEPDLVLESKFTTWQDLPNVPGIVFIDFPSGLDYSGHTTVWNGAGTVDGADINGKRVFFWSMPCFVPDERKILVTDKSDRDIVALP